MKLRFLLIALFFSSGILYAQNDTIKHLIFTEMRSGGDVDWHVEITNVGDEPVQMGDFKFAKLSPYVSFRIYDVHNDVWGPNDAYFFLPEGMLQPGETYIITGAVDFGPRQYRNKVPGFEGTARNGNPDWYDVADLEIHWKEYKSTEEDIDSMTTAIPGSRRWGDIQSTLANWRGRSGYYLEQHFQSGDSAVVDQVNCVFLNDGKNEDSHGGTPGYDVAGVEGASASHILVRKASVKSGTLDFANARGVGLDDSEWIPIPKQPSHWRDLYWIHGNHGSYNLDENTLESDVIDVDFAGKTLTVPWGIRRGDGIMREMVEKPGVAWEYILNPNYEDSLSFAAHTGDKLRIYVAGDDLDVAEFDIVVEEPAADVNIVVPVSNLDPEGYWRDDNEDAILGWPRITQHETGPDTITGTWFGLPYATRIDSLTERMEKATNAEWAFQMVDGVERPDLKDGDKLIVTAENGDVKEYYIQVQPYKPSHNAFLSAITWPDIPDFYRGLFGWVGDTVPNFTKTAFNYRVQVPVDVEGIPALQAKAEDLNSTVNVKRATSLSGTSEDRTVEFEVIAEDDSVTNTYSVELVKEKDPNNVQPFRGEPFFSERVHADQWSNFFAEIVNPGNQPLDLSDYMIVGNWTSNPADAVEWSSDEDDWDERYVKYVPGYKWVDKTTWGFTPGVLERDLNVNAIVQPGDVFVFGAIYTDNQTRPGWLPNYKWPVPGQLDVQFNNNHNNYSNPWNEFVKRNNIPTAQWGGNMFLFKILNDSVKQGLKPANDPNDFELIEALGMTDVSNWVVGGWSREATSNMMRKPDVYEPVPELETSFGTNEEDSEWTWTTRAYWQARNAGWPMEILNIGNDLGQHFMVEPTHYKSTVSSLVYKVSEGYSMDEEIWGMVTGATVDEFLGNLIKADEDQVLTVKSNVDGSQLTGDTQLSLNDTLVVLSADSTNTTKYVLEVSEDGLSSDAVLTSERYDITITEEPKSAADNHMGEGTVSGFEYGTQLQTVLNNITVPAGASMDVIDSKGAYVSQKVLNYDTAYVFTTVSQDIYLDVTAEDGVTKILYQLQPQTSPDDAFILSDIYTVVQRNMLVEFVPRGTTVGEFLSNVVASTGATVEVVDKWGNVRVDGNLVQDDEVVVTSPSGEVQNVYFLSMLRNEYIFNTTYLAYVLSNTYNVDQVDNVISGATGSTLLDDFLGRIEIPVGATVSILDEQGNEKSTGDLDDGDIVRVVSQDGKIQVEYTLNLDLTGTEAFDSGQIKLYPNPTDGLINISGVQPGGRIQVFNSTGASVRDMQIRNNIETVSLNDQPSGMYVIVVSDENQMLGRYKVVRK